MLTVGNLKKLIQDLDDDTPIYVRHGVAYDDAYPAKVRAFNGGDVKAVLYVMVDDDEARENHRNYPEGYTGAKEIPLRKSRTKNNSP